MLTKYDTTKQKRIWYYTDDVSKFSDDISNKEHQIEGSSNVMSDWLQEVIINNKGDIVTSKLVNNANYKNSYIWEYSDTKIHATLLVVRTLGTFSVVFLILLHTMVLMIIDLVVGLLKLQF